MHEAENGFRERSCISIKIILRSKNERYFEGDVNEYRN